MAGGYGSLSAPTKLMPAFVDLVGLQEECSSLGKAYPPISWALALDTPSDRHIAGAQDRSNSKIEDIPEPKSTYNVKARSQWECCSLEKPYAPASLPLA